jgi:predicted GTPase
MPYGDLAKQAVQRFGCYDDLDFHNVTIEEREEYESHIANDTVVYAGVDYEAILRQAEAEADVVLWDGGNNDLPFFKPDLWTVVADPLRAGHELTYYPGAVNFRAADVIIVNKANTASAEQVKAIEESIKTNNPEARVIMGASEVTVDNPDAIKGKNVLLVDDGPTMTHGEMAFGAGKVAADKYGAASIVDPRPFATGSIAEVFAKFPHLGAVLPAMGYFDEQIADLTNTIDTTTGVDSVLIATPMDLRRLITINKPCAVASYALVDMEGPKLSEEIDMFVEKFC